MARKETITKKAILETAFSMLQEEGIEEVTARKLAARANCSTQPIFRHYKNMDELIEELFLMAINYYEDFYLEFPRKSIMPFVNLGIAYIEFAKNNENIFKVLFLSENRHGKSLYELINGSSGVVGKEIALAVKSGCKDPQGLFMKMWIFIHGAACMTLTGDYDLNEEETIKMLKNSYQSFG